MKPWMHRFDPEHAPVMDRRFFEEIVFDGFERWDAAWDVHASGPWVYMSICSEGPFCAAAQVVRYDTRNGNKEHIADLDRAAGIELDTGIMPQSKVHTSFSTLKDGRLFFCSHNTANGYYHPTWALQSLWHDASGFTSQAFVLDQDTKLLTHLGAPVPNDDLYYGQLDPELNIYYTGSIRDRTVYAIRLDDFSVRELPDINAYIAIAVDDDHKVYCCQPDLRVWEWDPFTEKARLTDLRLPRGPLIKNWNGYNVYMKKEWDGWIYAEAARCNRICRFKPQESIMEDLGPSWREDPEHPEEEMIFAPVLHPNGKLYYQVLNETDTLWDGAEVIELDPNTRQRRNLGTMPVSDGSSNACIAGEGTLGADGRIYWADGNTTVRGTVLWAFDPRLVPADYEPTETVPRRERHYIDFPTHFQIERPAARKHLYRMHPQVREILKIDFAMDSRFSGEHLQAGSLIDAGIPVWNTAVQGLTLGANGKGWAVVGMDEFALVEVELERCSVRKAATIPANVPILNGSVVAAVRDRIFTVGDHLFAFSNDGSRDAAVTYDDGRHPIALCASGDEEHLFVQVDPENVIEIYRTDTFDKIATIELGGYASCRWLVPAPDGGVIGFGNNATVFHITPNGEQTVLPGRLPALRGTEFITEVTGATVAANGTVWGGTREGYLFSVDVSAGVIRNWGKPGADYLKGIMVMDGGVYAFSGGDFGCTHLHRLDPPTGFSDLGVACDKLVNVAVALPDNTIILGEYCAGSRIRKIRVCSVMQQTRPLRSTATIRSRQS